MGVDFTKADTGHPGREWPTMKQDEKILRLRTVLLRTGLSKSTLYRRIAEGTFPRQFRIGEQSTGWYESEVSKWVSDPLGYKAPVDACVDR